MLLVLPNEPTPTWFWLVGMPGLLLLLWGLRRLEVWMQRRNEQEEQARRERIRAAQKTRGL